MKKLMFLAFLFLAVNAFASIPIKDENGCAIGSRGAEAYGYKEDTKDYIPWYLILGDVKIETHSQGPNCPKISKSIIEIKIPFGRVVGHLESVFSDTYITVPTANEVKYFPTKDVYVEETQSWSFKDMR